MTTQSQQAAKAIPDKANEITGIPGFLAQLDLESAVVSIDGMGGLKHVVKAVLMIHKATCRTRNRGTESRPHRNPMHHREY